MCAFYEQSGSLHWDPGQLNAVPQLSFFQQPNQFSEEASFFAGQFISTEVKHQLHSFIHMKFKAVVRLINQSIFLTSGVNLRVISESSFSMCHSVVTAFVGLNDHTVADKYEIA